MIARRGEEGWNITSPTSTGSSTSGVSSRRFQRRFTSTHHQKRRRRISKKAKEILEQLQEGFTVVALDETFFYYDSLIKKVAGKRPVAKVTGSHKHSCVFGALSIDGRRLFRQYEHFDGEAFKDFLRFVHYKFPRCYLFLDRARQHYKDERVQCYFEGRKDSLIPVWQPTAFPEFMPLEECWNISKDDLLVQFNYSSYDEFKVKVGEHFRTKRFNLDIKKYLVGEVG